MKIIRGIKIAIHWNRALTHTAKCRFRAAFDELEKLEEIMGFLELEAALLKATVYSGLHDYEKAILLANRIVRLIDDKGPYTADKNAYVRTYASVIGLYCDSRIRESPSEPTETRFREDYDKIVLSRVPKHWKLKYPLPDHPDWNKETI